MSKALVALGSKVAAFSRRHPIVRGMASYATIWPTSCLIQQSFEGKRWGTYDWAECGRYCLYGSLFTAPTLYMWIRVSTKLWPSTTIRTAMLKAVVEQVSYGPAAMCCFFYGMSLLEGKTHQQSLEEVKIKFWPTYQVAVCFWPFLQTVNFAYISEKNRVFYTSVCSLVWVSFLAYMKHLKNLESKQLKESENTTK